MHISKVASHHAMQVYSLSSFCGTMLGTASRIPCEVLKQRLQAGIFNNVGEAVVGTLRQDGIKGFFRGTKATLMREVPFYVAGTRLYEEAKKVAPPHVISIVTCFVLISFFENNINLISIYKLEILCYTYLIIIQHVRWLLCCWIIFGQDHLGCPYWAGSFTLNFVWRDILFQTTDYIWDVNFLSFNLHHYHTEQSYFFSR